MASVLRGCDEPSSVGSDCLYRYGNGLLRMHITGSAETGFRVETVEFS